MPVTLLVIVALAAAAPVLAVNQPVAGKKLLLKDKAGKAKKRSVNVLANGGTVTIGDGNGSAHDPVTHGGSLRLYTTAGEGFDDTYDLPAAHWRYLGKEGADKGYKLKGAPPIKTVLVKPGRKLKIVAKGSALGHRLGANPAPVHVVLALGELRLCLEFGGTATFKEGKKYLGRNAPAPATCPSTDPIPPQTTTTTPEGSSTTTTIEPTTTTVPAGSTTTTSTSTTTSTTLYGSFADAPPEALARLDEVLAAAVAIMNGGGTYDDVVAMLAGEPDVSDVRIDGVTLHLTVAGLPSGLHDGQAARLRDPTPEPLGATSPPPLAVGPVPGGVAAGTSPTGERMVGEDRNLDGRRDVEKKALVLSPFAYEFGSTDSGPTVSGALAALPDYAGRVDVHAVTSTPTGLFPLTHYTNWDDYEVIHVSTHGDTNTLFLASAPSTCTAAAAAMQMQLPDPLDRIGTSCFALNVAAQNTAPAWTQANVSATPAFFVSHYPGGLERKVIYLDACRTTFRSGLVDALLGQDSIVIGWDEYVDSAHAKATAAKLYQDAAGRGYPMWRSFVRQCSGGGCIGPMGVPLAQGQTKIEEAEIAYDRADLRIREGLTVVPPFLTTVCYEDPMLPVELTCPSCVGTLPVSATFGIVVDGVVVEDLVLRQDPIEFAVEQLRLFADAHGVEQPYAWPLFDAVMSSTGADGQWMSLENALTLFVDGVCPDDTIVEYDPKVMLPAFDLQQAGNENRDFMYSVTGPYVIDFGQFPVP